jgi:hypothetical protein
MGNFVFESAFTPKQVPNFWKQTCCSLHAVCGITTYNNENTINQLLRTALDNFNIVILCDGGSTDKTMSIVNDIVEERRPKNLMITGTRYTDTKSGIKRKAILCNVIKNNFKNVLACLVEGNFLMVSDVRDKLFANVSNWTDSSLEGEASEINFLCFYTAGQINIQCDKSNSTQLILTPLGLKFHNRNLYGHIG